MHDHLHDEEAIFHIARRLPPDQQAVYLKQVCGDDRELSERIEVLLKAHEDDGFLKMPSAEATATIDQTVAETPGMQIGRYRLLQQIGEGGFGVVFMAEQLKPMRQKVALKVIKPGMDTKEVIARFESERQALALMDHPNIARVFDGGSTEGGRPYFVMELVKGEPITDYCEKNDLTLPERLELFVSVCQAVQHAHQKGVIHRDIKPSNVLVTMYDGTPVVKVIDFGVAKALGQPLTERTLFTKFDQVVGTPLYMSPEQAGLSNLDIDTRADIYSLGVLLYELLTGATPFDRERLRKIAIEEVRRVIREEEPPKPSTKISSLGESATAVAQHRRTDPKRLSMLLSGDLDWIVMKALEKDRRRRYETSKDFAEDITRHLSHQPVAASPPSTAYRFTKFIKRHKAGVAVATAIAAVLMLGILGTSTGMFVAIHAWADAKNAAFEANAARDAEVAERQRAMDLAQREREAREEATKQREKAEQNERTAHWHLYVARQFPLIDAWKNQSFAELFALLNKLDPQEGQPDFRGWEHAYLRDQCNQAFRTLSVDGMSIAWGPEKRELAVGHKSGRLTIWCSEHWTLTRTLDPGKRQDIYSLEWSPDGSMFACGYEDGEVLLSSATTGEVLRTLTRFSRRVFSIAWSPAGDLLATTSQGEPGKEAEARIINVLTGEIEKILRCPEPFNRASSDYLWTVAWSPDRARLATAHRHGLVCVWETKDWKLVGHTHTGGTVLEWDEGGARLATTGALDRNDKKRLKILDRNATVIDEIYVGASRLTAFHWIKDDRILVGGDNQQLGLWDLRSHNKQFSLTANTFPIRQVLASANSECIISLDDGGAVRVSFPGHVVRPSEILTGTTTERIDGIAWHETGEKLFATAGGAHIYLWDMKTNSLVNTARAQCGWFPHVICTRNLGTVTITNFGGAISWHESLQCSKELIGSVARFIHARVSPDGRWLTVCPCFTNAFIVNLEEGRIVDTIVDTKDRLCVWSHDSSRVYIIKRGLPLTGHVWNTNARRHVKLPEMNCFSMPHCLASSPVGEAIAIGRRNGSIMVLCAGSGRTLSEFEAHKGPVNAIDWAPDGRRLATTGEDGVLRIWDSSTVTELLAFNAPDDQHFGDVKWSADGRRLAAACGSEVHVFGSEGIDSINEECEFLETGCLAAAVNVGFKSPTRSMESTLDEGTRRGNTANSDAWEGDAAHKVRESLKMGKAAELEGRWQEAITYFATADTMGRSDLGESHPDTLAAERSLISALGHLEGDLKALASEGDDIEEAAELAVRLLHLLPVEMRHRWQSPRSILCQAIGAHDRIFAHVSNLRAGDGQLWVERGRVLALDSRWADAVHAYRKGIGFRGVGNETFEAAGLIYLIEGEASYGDFCATLVADYGDVSAPVDAYYHLARSVSVAPSGIPPEKAIRWAQVASAKQETGRHLHVLALAHYRAGNAAQATQLCERSMLHSWGAHVLNRYLIALAFAALGEDVKGRQLFEQAESVAAEHFKQVADGDFRFYPPDWIELEILRRESAIVFGKVPGGNEKIEPDESVREQPIDTAESEEVTAR